MRVGLITPQYPASGPSWGIGSYVRGVAAGLVEMGHPTFVLLACGRAAESYLDGQVEVRPVCTPAWLSHFPFPLGRGPSLSLANAMIRTAEELALDVVEAPDFSGLGAFLALFKRHALPVVVRMHTCSAIAREVNQTPVRNVRQRARRAIADALEKRSVVRADAVTAVSRASLRRTRELLGIARGDVTIIPNPVLETFFQSPESNDNPELRLLFVGRLEWIKGADRIIRALPLILQQNPGTRLQMVGTDSMTAPGGTSMLSYLNSMLDDRLRARVEFLGYVPHDRMRDLYFGASVCVFPSRWEGLPIACQEAMACGRAVVMSDIPVAPELIIDGCTGLVADAEDPAVLAAAVNRLLQDPNLRVRLGSAAREHARRSWSTTVVASATADVYRAAIAAAAPR